MKKTLLQTILVVAILALVYWVYSLINAPLEFERIRKSRESVVVERLKDIRTAQRAYRTKYNRFTPSFDSLIRFIESDSMVIDMTIGSADDSTAVAQGLVFTKRMTIAVKDTIFPANYNARDLRYIPFSDVVNENLNGTPNQFAEFQMDTASIETESKVIVPVFEAFAPYTTFLGDLDNQELINFRDIRINTLGRDDGLKVGSLNAATNEAGNWE